MSFEVKDVINSFEDQILRKLAQLRDAYQNDRADFSTKIRNYMSDR